MINKYVQYYLFIDLAHGRPNNLQVNPSRPFNNVNHNKYKNNNNKYSLGILAKLLPAIKPDTKEP